MSRIIIVTGSARPNSVSKKVVPLIEDALRKFDSLEVTVVDVAELQLPFYDAPVSASHEDFAPTDMHVQAWTKQVADADGVILLTPEYNGNVTAVQKNAIDWIYKEWNDKPVALIGYGWYEPSRSQEALKVTLGVVKATLIEPFAQLQFMKDITVEGELVDSTTVNQKLEATLTALVSSLSKE